MNVPSFYSETVRALVEGRVWKAARALIGADEALLREVADAAGNALSDRREVLDLACELAFAPPPPPQGIDPRTRLLSLEIMGLLSAYVALAVGKEGWREIAPCLASLSGAESPFRVREAAVVALTVIATDVFEESRSFWQESLTSADSARAGAAVRALGASGAPVLRVLDLFDAVIFDTRKAVRESIAQRALEDLARRDAHAVYERLRRWIATRDEIARWTVARALQTALGGMYVEDALEILGVLAGDERPMVWHAAAGALAEVAQRNPRRVLPEIARWRDDPERFRTANRAFEVLAKR